MRLPQITELCHHCFELQQKGEKFRITDNEIYNFTADGLCPHPEVDRCLTCASCLVKRPGQARRLIRFAACDSIRDHVSILPHMVAKCFDFK